MADFNRIARARLESLGAYKECDRGLESPLPPDVEGEDATTRYEVLAESFFLRYGELAPGKDRGVEGARIDPERVLSHLWRTWLSEKKALTQNDLLTQRLADAEAQTQRDGIAIKETQLELSRLYAAATDNADTIAQLAQRADASEAKLAAIDAAANEPDEVITEVREALNAVLTANVTTARKSLMVVLMKARHAIDVLVVRAAMGAKMYASLCAQSARDAERIAQLEEFAQAVVDQTIDAPYSRDPLTFARSFHVALMERATAVLKGIAAPEHAA